MESSDQFSSIHTFFEKKDVNKLEKKQLYVPKREQGSKKKSEPVLVQTEE
jgi:hypothetical protein